jgi:hypothetical protein
MHFDRKLLTRAFLAFTTGMFLACAARVSAANAAVSSTAAVTSTR